MIFDALIVISFILMIFFIVKKPSVKKVICVIATFLIIMIFIVAVSLLAAPTPKTKELLTNINEAIELQAIDQSKYLQVYSSPVDGSVWYGTMDEQRGATMTRASKYVRVASLEGSPFRYPVLIKCVAPKSIWTSQIFNRYYYVLVVPNDGLLWSW